MKAMIAGFAATVVIAVVAHFALQNAGFSAQDQSVSPSVRLE
jgi:hypothetical protein